jgi:hypothetical protein
MEMRRKRKEEKRAEHEQEPVEFVVERHPESGLTADSAFVWQ